MRLNWLLGVLITGEQTGCCCVSEFGGNEHVQKHFIDMFNMCDYVNYQCQCVSGEMISLQRSIVCEGIKCLLILL